MTAMKTFAIVANGTPMGSYEATDADAAILAYIRDAGYKSLEEAATLYETKAMTADEIEQIIEDWKAELDVEELEEVA